MKKRLEMDNLKWSIDQIKSKTKNCKFELEILDLEVRKLQEFIIKIAKTDANLTNLDNTNWLSLVTLSAQAQAISNQWEFTLIESSLGRHPQDPPKG